MRLFDFRLASNLARSKLMGAKRVVLFPVFSQCAIVRVGLNLYHCGLFWFPFCCWVVYVCSYPKYLLKESITKGLMSSTTGTLLQSLLLVLLCFLNGEARGQSCVPFKGSPATGGKCNTIITFANIYLPPGQHFQQVSISHKSILFLFLS